MFVECPNDVLPFLSGIPQAREVNLVYIEGGIPLNTLFYDVP